MVKIREACLGFMSFLFYVKIIIISLACYKKYEFGDDYEIRFIILHLQYKNKAMELNANGLA